MSCPTATSVYGALPVVARAAIEAHLAGRRYTPDPGRGPLAEPAGAFVTLRAGGALRGCIGHIAPTLPSVAQETAHCAVLAATQDPRFAPVAADELRDLRVEVSVLLPPEAVAGPEALDPARYGVIVSAGDRRGVLLPGIAGIDSVAEQLRVVRAKAGIGAEEPIELERFRTVHVAEANA